MFKYSIQLKILETLFFKSFLHSHRKAFIPTLVLTYGNAKETITTIPCSKINN